MSKSKTAAKRWPLPPRTTAVLLVIAFLVVVSTALATSQDGSMVRRNTSRSPDLETESAQLTTAQFYVDAQRASGVLVADDPESTGALDYYTVAHDELGVPIYSEVDSEPVDSRTIAKPIIVTYFDEVHEGDYATGEEEVASLPVALTGELADAVKGVFDAEALASGGGPDPEFRADAFASISFDDGETWKQFNLSQSALKSSFTLANGIEYPGTVDNVKHAVAGNKILVVWNGKYAREGSPRYALKQPDGISPLEYYGVDENGVPGEPIHYLDATSENTLQNIPEADGGYAPLDIWGVAGAQKSINYETWMHHGVFPFAEVGEVPFSAIWTCRGVIQQVADEVTGELEWGVKWRKPERLTSGVRDANYTAIDGAENVGFGICWQEDPEGLRPGYGEGPGEGWSGATANHKTDIWYSFIRWEDFDGVEDPAWVSDWYQQDPDQFTPINDPLAIDALETNKPQVYERMSMPQRITDNNGVFPNPTVGTSGQIVDLYAYLGRVNDEVPTLSVDDTGVSWLSGDGDTVWSSVAEDGRVMQGQVAATRTRMMMEGWVKDDGSRGAWVLLGYEETKGLGPGNPDVNPDGVAYDLGKNVKAETFAFDQPDYAGAGHIINEIDTDPDLTVDDGTYYGLIPNDFTVDQYATAIARRPSLFTNPIIKSGETFMEGGMTSAIMLYKEGSLRQGGPADIMMRRWVLPLDWDPATIDVDNPFDFKYLHNDVAPDSPDTDGWDDAIVTAQEGLTGTIYPREWYPLGVLIDGALNLSSTVPVLTEPLEGGEVTALSVVPNWHADIFPELAVKVDDATLTFEDCSACHAESWGDTDGDGLSEHNITERVLTWDQLDENKYDHYWNNGFEMSKGHRGFIDGDFVMVIFGHSPNWLMASHGKDPVNLYCRRSFDGGITWTTTPAELGGDGAAYEQFQGVGQLETSVVRIDRDLVAGEFEPMRNVSDIYWSSGTIIDPRYSPSNFRRQSDTLRRMLDSYTYDPLTGTFTMEPLTVGEALDDARDDDVRDPSKFMLVYETGNTGAVAEGAEATPENLYAARAINYGDEYDEIKVEDDTAGDYYIWDWLENQRAVKSGEASIAFSPGGQFMWAVWNQWEEDEYENVFDSDAYFRRLYWLPDDLRETVDVSIVGDPVAVEGELVTLTADATYSIGDDAQPADDVTYFWDLDTDGEFETAGQEVTMEATGAMQSVSVLAVSPTRNARDIETGWINRSAAAPRVWNVKVANGNTGLAGARVKLQANFRSPGIIPSAPLPADYDFSMTAVIDWGDGTIEAGTIASKNDGQGSQRFVTGVHKYGRPGLYTVKVTVTNADGASAWNYLEYAVIVHRKAGALAMAGTFEDPNGEGDASIAANVKYKLKARHPSGKVLFTLGDKSFVSEKLDWMAISGRKGWIRGQGQLNGVGGYDFLLAVVDDRKNLNDLVRVKVWKANGKMETVVYDSQPGSPLDAVAITPMKTGKITIPLFKGKSWKYYLMRKK